MASIEERFQAAVNVIKGLPKNGPYQPSTAMMLKFYGLYKQATEGSCEQKKPAFWDIVGKAKWDAWNDNRQLTKQQAMQRYVEGLQEIIETMSFTENVQNFVGSVSGLNNLNLDELEMVAPGMRELAESHPNSPFNSRTNSPHHGASTNSSAANSPIAQKKINSTVPAAQEQLMNGHITNGHADDNIVENGINSSTSLNGESAVAVSQAITARPQSSDDYTSNFANATEAFDDECEVYDDPLDLHHDLTVALSQNSSLLQQIQATVVRMNEDINAVTNRMSTIDQSLQDLRSMTLAQQKSTLTVAKSNTRRYPKWWPFTDISPAWFVILVLWPFLVRRFAAMLNSPRRR